MKLLFFWKPFKNCSTNHLRTISDCSRMHNGELLARFFDYKSITQVLEICMHFWLFNFWINGWHFYIKFNKLIEINLKSSNKISNLGLSKYEFLGMIIQIEFELI